MWEMSPTVRPFVYLSPPLCNAVPLCVLMKHGPYKQPYLFLPLYKSLDLSRHTTESS